MKICITKNNECRLYNYTKVWKDPNFWMRASGREWHSLVAVFNLSLSLANSCKYLML